MQALQQKVNRSVFIKVMQTLATDTGAAHLARAGSAHQRSVGAEALENADGDGAANGRRAFGNGGTNVGQSLHDFDHDFASIRTQRGQHLYGVWG